MSRYLIDDIDRHDRIRVCYGTEVVAMEGSERLERVRCRSSDGDLALDLAALFVFIGQEPHTEWLEGVVVRDEKGFLVTGADLMVDGRRPAGWRLERAPYLLETSVPGVFAAGDVRQRSIKRIASAVGDGAMAVRLVHEYLAGQ
jgi:thioredoxin reductase (NADPH)